MLAPPELLAVDDEGRHPENPRLLRRGRYASDLARPLAGGIVGEARDIRPGFAEHAGDDGRVFDVELALPEAREGDVLILPQHVVALAFGVEEAAGREGRV